MIKKRSALLLWQGASKKKNYDDKTIITLGIAGAQHGSNGRM
jgi:hypothetical protein